jgi:putative transposase
MSNDTTDIQLIGTREDRGKAIAKKDGQMIRINDHSYKVKSQAVEFSFNLRKQIEKIRIEPIDSSSSCIYCHSTNIIKRGIRHNKYGDIQRFFCNDCHTRFTVNAGFEGMKSSPQIITSAMQLYFSGESLRNVAKSLVVMGVNVSHVAVYKWIEKYTLLMKQYLEKIKPNVSDTWRADEVWIKVSGDMK